MSSTTKPEPLDLKATFGSRSFRWASAFVGAMLVGAYLTEYTYFANPHAPIVWFYFANSLASAFLTSCTLLGYVGVFIFFFTVATPGFQRYRSRVSALRSRASLRRVLMVAAVAFLLIFLVGWDPVIDATMRFDTVVSNLMLLAGLEVAEAWAWQRGGAILRQRLRHG